MRKVFKKVFGIILGNNYPFLKSVKNLFLIPFEKRTDELYIFGNGYTLVDLDLLSFQSQDIFVCNEIFRHESFLALKKGNNLLHFVMDNAKVFEELTPTRLNISVKEAYANRLNPILELDHNIVLNKTLKNYVLSNYPSREYIPHDILYNAILENLTDQVETNLIDFDIRHTPHLMILTAIFLGYKKIYLYGLEHNYVKDILNKDRKCGTHFYGESYKQVLEFNNGKNLSRDQYKITLSKLFEGNAKTFKTYEKLADLAKERGIEIIDHSGGSLFMFQDYSLWDLVEPPNK
jgi:hypothetical protein